jgi:hypothetical protein
MHTPSSKHPIINTAMRAISRAMLRLMGWRTEGLTPDEIAAHPKYMLIAAPHTSNWDFPITLMVCFVLRNPGVLDGQGQPVQLADRLAVALAGRHRDRPQRQQQYGAEHHRRVRRARAAGDHRRAGRHARQGHALEDRLLPHGAWRRRADRLAYLDFARKAGGIGRMFTTTGDISADMEDIQQFYLGVTGKNPQQFDAASVIKRK